MKVYIVREWDQGGCSYIIGVYDSEIKAREHAQILKTTEQAVKNKYDYMVSPYDVLT